PASVTLVKRRLNSSKLSNSFNTWSPASVILDFQRSTPTTGLPGSFSSTVTLPRSFSTIFTAAASSVQPGPARTNSPSTTPALTVPRCCAMMILHERSVKDQEFRQCCLEFLYPRVRYRSFGYIQNFQSLDFP